MRLKQVEQYVVEKKKVTIDEISKKFNIHPNTARSDINKLAERGVVQKRYGYVEYISPELQISFTERNAKNVTAKEIIGQKASTLLEENDVIFIDTGSTATRLLQSSNVLPQHLTVISNSIEVLETVSANTNYTLFALPGQFIQGIGGFLSLETIESLKTYNIKKGFIGVRGISINGDLTTDTSIDAKIKSTTKAVCKKLILMADKEKLEQPALFNFASLSEFDYWVSDDITPVMQELSKNLGFTIL